MSARPRHVTLMMAMHKQLRHELRGLRIHGPKYQLVSEVGVAIEKALTGFGVNPRGEAIDENGRPKRARGKQTECYWIFWPGN